MKAIEQAIEAVGGRQRELAKRINVTPQQVNQWVIGGRQVPANRCLAIERATAGRVTCHQLRPDVFPAPSTQPGDAGQQEAA